MPDRCYDFRKDFMSDETLDHDYPGVGRLYYFLARVMLIIVTVFAVIYFGPESSVFGIVSLAAMVAGVVLDVMRLRNIGVSQWFLFLRFIPWLGLVLSIGLQSAQTGWSETRRLDRAGWAIIGAHAVLIAAAVFLLYRSGFTGEVFAIPFR